MSKEKTNKKKNDVFAEIASRRIKYRDQNLVEPQPPELKDKELPLQTGSETCLFKPERKLNTQEELQQELESKQNQYKKYMQDLAPELKSYRSRKDLIEFDWRKETERDRRNFQQVLAGKGEWEQITIPHYGDPLGQAVTFYRTTFNLTKKEVNSDTLFICFKGVDYKAHVFINNSYLGSHQGFFAPFEFEFANQARQGENVLVVKVENDFICGGNFSTDEPDKTINGDKIYAATGPGYDDPEFGWHHCPPGMGIYQDVYIEARPSIHISDIFVRPLLEEGKAEAWLEINNCTLDPREIKVQLSVYGQNFEDEVFSGLIYKPGSTRQIGVGDTLTEAKAKADGELNKSLSLFMEKGINYLKIPFGMKEFRKWEPENPWLYQLQVRLMDSDENVVDSDRQQFGMRSFKMDSDSEPRGEMTLNGSKIRLRGANTMGHLQQCVMKRDWEQLRDDILLAKICNMNFLRITQRPVQSEIYEYCDKLGLMTQTDLPLFGVLRRNQYWEAVRQAEEMEKLVRSHPCNILISYINEPFPNAGNKPHRHLAREELTVFFKAANQIVHLNNPDQVIKAVDGDYDPPAPGLPDNHCYCGWYNGHGVDIGKLHKGYWQYVKPGWYYGCGEFGAEGLDPVNTMKKYYPDQWLPWDQKDEKDWSPNSIIKAQTGNFHYFFYETPDSLEGWVNASQRHQAWVARFMTEAFRRDWRMNTFAIHLFIDAFPAGWMKAIMDVERQPKLAYFVYREALTPLMVNLRTDRFKYFSGDEIRLEAWVCNDLAEVPEGTGLKYQILKGNKVIAGGKSRAEIPECSSNFQGFINIEAPEVTKRTELKVQLALISKTDEVLHDTEIGLEVFPAVNSELKEQVVIVGSDNGKAVHLMRDLSIKEKNVENLNTNTVILIDDYKQFDNNRKVIMQVVEDGATAIFLELPEGEYNIYGNQFKVKASGMLPLHFVACNTGHQLVEEFKSDDFRLWYDPSVDYITPLLESTFTGEGFIPILTTGNTNKEGKWEPALATAEMEVGKGKIYINQVKLTGRIVSNPVAKLFASRLLK